MNLDRIKIDLRADEGYARQPYRCPAGKLTIGVGHNIEDNGLSDEVIEHILEEDVAKAEADAREIFSSYDELDEVRQEVLVNMAFNMGRSRLAKFIQFIEAVKRNDFAEASNQMVDSGWYKQVGRRAQKLAMRMAVGIHE